MSVTTTYDEYRYDLHDKLTDCLEIARELLKEDREGFGTQNISYADYMCAIYKEIVAIRKEVSTNRHYIIETLDTRDKTFSELHVELNDNLAECREMARRLLDSNIWGYEEMSEDYAINIYSSVLDLSKLIDTSL